MFDYIVNSINQHPAIWAAGATWFLGNICAALPTPPPDAGRGYQFLFNLATLIGAALPRSFPNLRLPGGKNGT